MSWSAVRGGRRRGARSEIVQQLESGQADLDEAITLWERGEELYRLCSDKLDSAQGKIEELARRVDAVRPEKSA